jgi:hypothetical protein
MREVNGVGEEVDRAWGGSFRPRKEPPHATTPGSSTVRKPKCDSNPSDGRSPARDCAAVEEVRAVTVSQEVEWPRFASTTGVTRRHSTAIRDRDRNPRPQSATAIRDRNLRPQSATAIRDRNPRPQSATPIRDPNPRPQSATPIRDPNPRPQSATPIRDRDPQTACYASAY